MSRAVAWLLGALLLLQGCAPAGSAPPSPSVTPAVAVASPSPSPAPAAPEIVHRPRTSFPAPAVLLIPGGGWQRGDPREMDAMARHLAQRGFVAMAAGHRVAPFPAPLEDVRSALSRLRGLPGVDGKRIGIVGKSSGGHLAAVLGVSEDVQAVVLLCAPTNLVAKGRPSATQRRVLARTFGNDPEVLRRYSPALHVRAGLPPFLLLHGQVDELVPASQSEDLQRRLLAAGGEAELRIFAAVGQDFGSRDGRTPEHVEDAVVEFLERPLKP